jgi:ubiquinone/menaquinone biosynthesis C-methylase UbiE
MTSKQKAYKGMPMEGPIASWYAKITDGNARGFDRIAADLAERVRPGARLLEVAPGPGYLALALAKLGDYRITGIDISRSFVRIATENARKAGVSIDFRHGNASEMPFEDGSFDFVVCVAAFKNFTDPVGALDETWRVLAPGGGASIQDLCKDASPDAIRTEVEGMGLSRVNAALTKLVFRHTLLRNAYTREDMRRLVGESRFGTCEIVDRGIGFEVRLQKRTDGKESPSVSVR